VHAAPSVRLVHHQPGADPVNAGRHRNEGPLWWKALQLMFWVVILLIGLEGLREVLTGHLR